MKYIAVLDGEFTRVEIAKIGGVDFNTAKREAHRYLKSQQQAIYDTSMILARSWPCETCGAVTQLSNTAFHRFCQEHMVGTQI